MATVDFTALPDGAPAGFSHIADGVILVVDGEARVTADGDPVDWYWSTTAYTAEQAAGVAQVIEFEAIFHAGGDTVRLMFHGSNAALAQHHAFELTGSGSWLYLYDGGLAGASGSGVSITFGVPVRIKVEATSSTAATISVGGSVLSTGSFSPARTGLYGGIYLSEDARLTKFAFPAAIEEGGGGEQDLTGSHIASGATVTAPTVTRGAVAVAPPAIGSAAQLFTPTITRGAVTVSPPVIASTAVLFAPALRQTLRPPLIASTVVLSTPTVTRGAVGVAPPAITSAAVLSTPTVTRGPVAVSPPRISSTAALSPPTVTQGPVTLSPPAIASSATLTAPTVTRGPVTVTAPHIASTATLAAPTLSQGDTLAPPLIASAATMAPPVVTRGPVSVSLPAIASTVSIAAPTVTRGAVAVSPPAIGSSASVSPPTVATGAATLSLPSIPSGAVLSPSTVTTGPIAVVLPLIPSGVVLFAPTVFVGDLVQPGTSSSTVRGRAASSVVRGGASSSAVLPGPSQHGWLTPTVGYVITPDTSELTITSDVRITALVRDDSAVAAATRVIADKVGSVGTYAWRFSTFDSPLIALGWPDGQPAPQIYIPLGDRTLYGLTPPGADRYVGVDFDGVDPGSSAASLVATGLTSDDGATWTPVQSSPAVRADALSFDSTASVRVGTSWQGRIYWVQMETLDEDGNPDELVWRFDADDYPGTGTSYEDPRGRTWTMTAPGAITPAVIAQESSVSSLVLP